MYSLIKPRSDSPADSAARRTQSTEDKMSASSDEPKKRDKDTGAICRSNIHLCLSVVNVFHDLVNVARFIAGREGLSVCDVVRGTEDVSDSKIV